MSDIDEHVYCWVHLLCMVNDSSAVLGHFFSLSVAQTISYFELGVTPGVDKHLLEPGQASLSLEVSFPFGTSVEHRVHVSF